MKQGKCTPCKTIWVWEKDVPTAQAPHCRDCGGVLVRTCMPALTPGDRPHSVVRRLSDGTRIPWGCSAAYEGPALEEPKAPGKTGQPIKRILVVDHTGNGYTVVCTLDGVTWDKYNHQPVNPYVKNQIMQRLMASDPQAEIREITSFWIEIPADWATPGCRIVG